MIDSSRKVVLNGLLIGGVLAVLLGGLALVIRSLRSTELQLDLDLKKDDADQKKK